ARRVQGMLQRPGIPCKRSSNVTSLDNSGNRFRAQVEPVNGGAPATIEADVTLGAVARAPYTEGLGLEAVGVAKDNRGRVVVDAHFQTHVAGIFAIGDGIAGTML